MNMILLGLAILLLTRPAFGQPVSPFPDTSPTGGTPEMLRKLTSAQSAFDQVGREISENQKRLDGLKPIMDSLVEENNRLKVRSDLLRKNWEERKEAFNSACASRPLSPSEQASCGSRRAQLEQRLRDYETENAELGARSTELKRRYDSLEQQQTAYETRIQKVRNWKSQVEPQIRSLKAAIVAQCKGIMPSPERLKAECGNIQFDNASSNLPPCTTEACIRARIMDWR